MGGFISKGGGAGVGGRLRGLPAGVWQTQPRGAFGARDLGVDGFGVCLRVFGKLGLVRPLARETWDLQPRVCKVQDRGWEFHDGYGRWLCLAELKPSVILMAHTFTERVGLRQTKHPSANPEASNAKYSAYRVADRLVASQLLISLRMP